MMDLHSTTFIGVDLKGGKRSYTYAALDGRMKLAAYGQGRLDDVFAFIGGCQTVLCAVNAPIHFCPEGGAVIFQDTLFPIAPHRGRKRTGGMRYAEHILMARGISAQNAPTRQDLPQAQVWIRRGFQFVELLEEAGFKPWPSEGSEKQYLEVQAEAAFWHWLETRPLNEDSLEGRIQRQLVLSEMNLDVPDPMIFFEEVTRYKLLKGQLSMSALFSIRELNAMICALTAYLMVTDETRVASFGNRDDGVIYLPNRKTNTG
jgi:hypothetical protein